MVKMYNQDGTPFTEDQLIERIVSLENIIAGYDQLKTKSDVEFSRYKQDCRKKALDAALDKFAGLFVDGQDAVIVNADKYYNWLISAPK